MAISDDIERARFLSGLKQREAAELVGVNIRTWQRWESGDLVPMRQAKLDAFLAKWDKQPCATIKN